MRRKKSKVGRPPLEYGIKVKQPRSLSEAELKKLDELYGIKVCGKWAARIGSGYTPVGYTKTHRFAVKYSTANEARKGIAFPWERVASFSASK